MLIAVIGRIHKAEFLNQRLHKYTTKAIAELDKDMIQGLEKAGFKFDYGPDGAGFLLKYFRKGGGYCEELAFFAPLSFADLSRL